MLNNLYLTADELAQTDRYAVADAGINLGSPSSNAWTLTQPMGCNNLSSN